MSDPGDTDSNDKGNKWGDSIWILVPLAALSIPIFAIIGTNVILTSVVAAVIGLVAITLAARSLMTHRHNLTMVELEAKERIVRAEREQMSAAERLLRVDDPSSDLGEAIRQPDSGDATPGQRNPAE